MIKWCFLSEIEPNDGKTFRLQMSLKYWHCRQHRMERADSK